MGLYNDPKYLAFWRWTDEHLKEKLEPRVKNILTFNGYGKFFNLKKLEVFPFDECQEAVRSQEYCTVAEEYEEQGEKLTDFFGFYHRNPQNFKFNSGDKSEINRLMELIQKTTPKMYKRSMNGVAENVDDTDPATNRELIKTAVMNHKKYNADLKHLITDTIAVVTEGARKGKVKCPVEDCQEQVAVYKRFQKKSWCWGIENFTKHFKTHSRDNNNNHNVNDNNNNNNNNDDDNNNNNNNNNNVIEDADDPPSGGE